MLTSHQFTHVDSATASVRHVHSQFNATGSGPDGDDEPKNSQRTQDTEKLSLTVIDDVGSMDSGLMIIPREHVDVMKSSALKYRRTLAEEVYILVQL